MSISENPIAIIGLSCRFPGANNIDEFWDLLSLGKNAIRYFSKEEMERTGIDPMILNDEKYVRARGILKNLESFDREEIAFSEDELTNVDLQAKIFLQLVSQALEDAGINPKSCPKETAIFSGANEFVFPEESANTSSKIHTMEPMIKLGYARSLSGIVAYQFDLRGSAVSLHTGCSTSSVAIIQGCEELLSHRANLAIAGGVSIVHPERMGYLYEEGGVLSPTGTCRPFDADANGTVLSNGAGVIVLKRLKDAIAARDKIYSIIIGKAINNDGRMKTGFLTSSIKGQHDCIERAWKDAKVGLKEINYIEAHGSATLVGDPIEMFALKKTLNGQSYDQKWCGIGSVKSNIGHTTIASGMAAIIKAALMTWHRTIVPTINFEVLNKNIHLEGTPFYIATKYEALPIDQKNFYLGVSNFGLGGTNTHMVLRDPLSGLC
jgi:acyl transferase domain-containing protein